jgi:hypothetical protein
MEEFKQIHNAKSPKWNVIVLQFFHNFKAHTLLLGVRFQQRPKYFAHTAAT